MLCTVCGRENSDEARFCNACGNELLDSQASERRKLVTVLFCDLADSTALGKRLDPETLKRILLDYYDAARKVVERHGGVVQKFIGDAVMSVFGVPSVREDDANRATRAAVEMRAAVEELNRQLEPRFGVRLAVRIGVNTGEVVTAHAGALALGDTINAAARLQESAEPGEVLLGATTVKLVSLRVDVEALDPSPLKGGSGHVAAYRLIQLRDSPGLDVSGPLIGREAELATILAAYERVSSSREAHLLAAVTGSTVSSEHFSDEIDRRLAEHPPAGDREVPPPLGPHPD